MAAPGAPPQNGPSAALSAEQTPPADNPGERDADLEAADAVPGDRVSEPATDVNAGPDADAGQEGPALTARGTATPPGARPAAGVQGVASVTAWSGPPTPPAPQPSPSGPATSGATASGAAVPIDPASGPRPAAGTYGAPVAQPPAWQQPTAPAWQQQPEGAPGWQQQEGTPGWQQQTGAAGWPQQPHPGVTPVPQQEGPGVTRVPPAAGFPEQNWTSDSVTPTAEDFARRRAAKPAEPVATMGVRAAVNKIGLVKLPPSRQEQEIKRDIEMVRRNFGGLRQVTVVNPKGGAGKTVAILLLAMTFGQKRGGYVLAWDNNETQGTLGMRAQQDFHSRTVRDLLRDLGQFQGASGRVGDLSQYVRSQAEGMFDVLASDESATGGEMLTAAAFAEIREVVSRFYKLIFVDTGNNVRAQNWQAAMDATDQLVVTMSARNDSAETAARMLDHLEQSGRQRLVRQAVTVVSMPASRKEIDLPAIQQHFAARTRLVLTAPYERLLDSGEPIRYGQLSSATIDAWLKIAAAVAEGL
ncbi:chromosome partitioning protein [Micromonosporaceae bacterium DT55]